MVRFFRRRSLLTVFLAFVSCPLASCAESDDDLLNPSGKDVLWVAQTLTGTVRLGMSSLVVADASVLFQVSLDREFWLTLGTARTGLDGSFSMSAALPGNPANFWRLEPPEDRDRWTVYWQVLASKPGTGSGVAGGTPLSRVPSRSAPAGNLAPYQLTSNVILVPIEGGQLER